MNLSTQWLAQLPLTKITSIVPVSGGDINLAFKITTATTNYFMKVQPQHSVTFFQHEIEGLKLLNQVVNTPTVIASGTIDGDAYLILNWIDTGTGSQADLGQAVAHLHEVTRPKFGLDQNFLAGRLPKNNQWQDDWATFYLNQRLNPLVKIAQQKKRWNPAREAGYQTIKANILADPHFHEVKPSLLHGDLWAGNYLFTNQGIPTLIDPDVFFGDRELDLAMTTIFGGFENSFYTAYQTINPLPAGFQQRLPWYQLNYLLAHLNLFGEAYGSAVDQILLGNQRQ